MNHRNIQRKHIANPLPGVPTVIFLHRQIIGCLRSHILVLRWSREQLAHNDLYWFKPLLGCNSTTSSCVILIKTSVYNRVGRVFERFTRRMGFGSRDFHLKGRSPFIECPGVPYLWYM
jgi:hypothetical protein